MDIGANLGNHTLYWSQNMDYERIYSFEPFTPNFEVLRQNVKDNGLKNIVLVHKGIGEKKGYTNILEFDESNYGGTTLDVSVNGEKGEIEITDIDSFAAEQNIERIDFIKIDTEGYEQKVLQGMEKTLNQFSPDLWIEVTASSVQPIVEKLRSLGYVIADIEGFNLLFLSQKRHGESLEEYSYMSALKQMFLYLKKTNDYYGNYMKTKQWLEDANRKLKQSENNSQNTDLKYHKALDDYETTKRWLSDRNKELEKIKKDLDGLREVNKAIQAENEGLKAEYKDSLIASYKDYDMALMVIEELKRKVQNQEIQNKYLKNENAQYRKKLSMITDTKWGQLAVKTYRMLQKIKSKILKK